jgi:hypothetical protein
MLTFCRTILLVRVRARNMMIYAYAAEKRVQGLILSTPICLNSSDFSTKLSLNKILKVIETLKNFGFVAQKIYPNIFAMIINKAHIISFLSNRTRGRPPHIRKNLIQRMTSRLRVRQLVTFALLTCIANPSIIRLMNKRKFMTVQNLLHNTR